MRITLDLTGASRADLSKFSDYRQDSAGNPCVWLNSYECPECATDWATRHASKCDDRCPGCDHSTSPHASVFCADVPPALRELWEALPEAAKSKTWHGMTCPKCGSDQDLRVAFKGVCKMTANGSEDSGDHDWDDDSACWCASCYYAAKAKDFE